MENDSDIRWRGHMSIQQVIAEIRANPQKTFWLAFVRATGKEVGSIKIVSRCLYGAPKIGEGGKALPVKSDRKRTAHVDKGTLPMTDADRPDEYLTPLISHIIGYNMYQVTH